MPDFAEREDNSEAGPDCIEDDDESDPQTEFHDYDSELGEESGDDDE